MRSKPLFERFWSKVAETPSGCWQWQAALTRDGYGKFGLNGRTLAAHRLAYRWWKGPIPSWLQIDHTCRNRACVNPAHLEAVTGQVNVGRGARRQPIKGAAPADWQPGRITHCPQGHEYTPDNTIIRRWEREGRTRRCRTCQNGRVRAWKRRRKAATAQP